MNKLKEGYTELYVGRLLDQNNYKNILRIIHMANRLGLEGKAITEISSREEMDFARTRWFYVWKAYPRLQRVWLVLTGRL